MKYGCGHKWGTRLTLIQTCSTHQAAVCAAPDLHPGEEEEDKGTVQSCASPWTPALPRVESLQPALQLLRSSRRPG